MISFLVTMATDWMRVLSDIPLEKQMLTFFLPCFLPGTTTQKRASTFLRVTPPPTVTRSPLQPRILDLFQSEVGLLPGFHLDGVIVTVTDLAPSGHERKKCFSSATNEQGKHGLGSSQASTWTGRL